MKYTKKEEPALSVKDFEAEYETNRDTKTYSIHEAKTNLSKLVKRAAAGETIYIGSYGKPEAVLTVFNERKMNAQLRAAAFGCMKGKMELPEELLAPWTDEEIEEMFGSMQGLEDFEIK